MTADQAGIKPLRRFRCKRCHCPVSIWADGNWKHFATRFRGSCGIQPTDGDVEPLPESTLGCNVCNEEKPFSQFYRNRSVRRRGYSYSCKPCLKKFLNVNQRRRSEMLYRKTHPDRTSARQAARHVPLGSRCEQCGSTDRLHRHHPDYSQPLNVLTLCQPCHEKVHHGYL